MTGIIITALVAIGLLTFAVIIIRSQEHARASNIASGLIAVAAGFVGMIFAITSIAKMAIMMFGGS